MRELRKLEKAVKKYEILLEEFPEEAKENKKIYIDDLENLVNFVKVYINDMSDKFKIWCDTNVAVLESPTSNMIYRIKRTMHLKIVEYYLNKFSENLSKARKLNGKLEKIQKRFQQYQYFS